VQPASRRAPSRLCCPARHRHALPRPHPPTRRASSRFAATGSSKVRRRRDRAVEGALARASIAKSRAAGGELESDGVDDGKLFHRRCCWLKDEERGGGAELLPPVSLPSHHQRRREVDEGSSASSTSCRGPLSCSVPPSTVALRGFSLAAAAPATEILDGPGGG
jgi:hypothetical protein